jgi:hypothetical protein
VPTSALESGGASIKQTAITRKSRCVGFIKNPRFHRQYSGDRHRLQSRVVEVVGKKLAADMSQ